MHHIAHLNERSLGFYSMGNHLRVVFFLSHNHVQKNRCRLLNQPSQLHAAAETAYLLQRMPGREVPQIIQRIPNADNFLWRWRHFASYSLEAA